MFRKKLLVLIISLFFVLISDHKVFAQSCIQPRLGCVTNPNGIPGINCRGTKNANGQCIINDPDKDCDACPAPFQTQPANPFSDVFGKIQPPAALKEFIGADPTGAGGISKLLSNIIALFYSIAIIVLLFMFIWGAFDWMTSEGDKEKLESAKRKIINALIGIMLFAVAFAVIRILGQFTGFEFFSGQTRPTAPPIQQPDNCTIRYNTCIKQAGNDIDAQGQCWETYQACLKTNL